MFSTSSRVRLSTLPTDAGGGEGPVAFGTSASLSTRGAPYWCWPCGVVGFEKERRALIAP